MSLPVSPLRTMTPMDRIQPQDLYRAVDFNKDRPRYLHISGDFLTSDKNYSWYGTKKQFNKICELHEWDALSLVPDIKSRS